MVRTSKDYENEFIEIPTGPGKHGEPIIRGKVPKVCLLASYVRYYDTTPERIFEMVARQTDNGRDTCCSRFRREVSLVDRLGQVQARA